MNKHDLHKGMLIKALQDMTLFTINPLLERPKRDEQMVSVPSDEVLMIVSIRFDQKWPSCMPEAHVYPQRLQDVYKFLHCEKTVYQLFDSKEVSRADNKKFFDTWKVITL